MGEGKIEGYRNKNEGRRKLGKLRVRSIKRGKRMGAKKGMGRRRTRESSTG